MPVVGDTLVWTETLTDDAGNPVSGEAANFSAVTARKPDGTTAFSPSIAEIGATGSYRATVTSDAAGSWYLFWHHVDAVTGEITGFSDSIIVDVDTGMTAARAAKLDNLGAASVTVQSPIINQVATVYQGDDYKTQRPLTWALTNVPDLTGATVTLSIVSDAVSLSIACTVANPGTALQTVTAHLTSVQTDSLEPPPVATNYDLSAVLATGSEVTTLARGAVKVIRDLP